LLSSFAAATRNLLAAEQRAGVRHHVLLSIVGIDRLEGNAYFAGKRRQEQLLSDSPVPVTIQRATQFHEFADMVIEWTRQGDVATVPPLLVQPVAGANVGLRFSPRSRPATHRVEPPISPDRNLRIWLTWRDARWRRGASRSG
jgi:uncharacterized protein YbjT (DUF2867 family)